MIKPDFFFLTQMLTLGHSDLRDLELIFMDPFDAVLYFLAEAFLLPLIQPVAIVWMTLFWWVYYAEFTWMMLVVSYHVIDSILALYVDE